MKYPFRKTRMLACLSALAIALGVASTPATALSNTAKVPVLLYHTGASGCTYSTNALMALAADLETMYSHGYTVVPVYWITSWVVGDMDGSALPDKVVGITFDDGNDSDWIDANYGGCGTSTSGKTVLNNFKAAHPDLPWYSPHATLFVIASQIARAHIGGAGSSSWWSAAQSSGIMEIYNHSQDHDHPDITTQYYDPFLQNYIAVGGYGDGMWAGQGNFYRIDTYNEADMEVRKAAAYIYGIIGVWPDLFAYPFGQASSYLVNTYFPTYGSEHQTYGAYCLGSAYATRSSNRYCIPRFTYNNDWGTSNTDTILGILNGAP
jgi:hypothetical protein